MPNIQPMKRFALTLALLAAIGLNGNTRAQKWFFYESFDDVAVDATGSGYVPEGFTLYNDANTPFAGQPDLSYFDAAWKVRRGMDGEGYAAAPSLFTNASAQANRWLVTPAIALTDASAPKLYFRTKSEDDRARDGFVLKISTTSADSSAFQDLRSVREARGTWREYTINLAEYAGKTIYLAFVQNSTGRQAIAIDDIRVGEAADGLGAACNNAHTPLYMIYNNPSEPKSFPVKATLQNWSNTAITSARLCVRMNTEDVVTQTFNNLNIAAAGNESVAGQTFSLDYTPAYADPEAEFEIWFDQLNGQGVATDHTTVPCFIAMGSSLPYKKTMLEIFSSATCSGCGGWNKQFHEWDSIYGGNEPDNPNGFVAAKFQVDIPTSGDPLVTPETLERKNFYGIGSAPTWMLNGYRFPLQGGDLESIARTLTRLLDSIETFRQTLSPLALAAKMDREGEVLNISTKITCRLPLIGKYRLYVTLAEDSIRERAQLSNETEYYNIVRKMLPDANGTLLELPLPGDSIVKTFTYQFGDNPALRGSLDRVGVAAYIQNTETREIIQATFAYGNGVWSKNDDKTRREAVADALVYPNPATETAVLAFRPLTDETLTVSLLDMQGRVLLRHTANGTGTQTLNLPVAGLPSGTYAVRIEGANGFTVVKLLKK